MILMIDNYDSFTFNLVQALEAAGAEVRVVRNDAMTREDVEALADDEAADLRGIVVSPGPGNPETPASPSTRSRSPRPAGSRCSACAWACSRWRPPTARPSSGRRRSSTARRPRSTHDGEGLLAGMPADFFGARYHSLCVDPATLPAELYVTATSPEDGVVMGLRHRSLPLEGVQFHPESVLTPDGPHLLANFLRLAGEGDASRLDDVSGSFATRGHGGAASPRHDGPVVAAR